MDKLRKWLMSRFVSRKIKLSKINEAYDTAMKCIDMDRDFLQNYECEGKNEDVTKLVKDWFNTKHVLYRQLLKCDRMLEESYEKISQLCFDDLEDKKRNLKRINDIKYLDMLFHLSITVLFVIGLSLGKIALVPFLLLIAGTSFGMSIKYFYDDMLERMQSDNVQILLKKYMSHILEYRNNINSFISSRDKYDDKFISNVCSLQDQDRDKGNSFEEDYSYKFDGYSINSGMRNNKGRGRVRRR